MILSKDKYIETVRRAYPPLWSSSIMMGVMREDVHKAFFIKPYARKHTVICDYVWWYQITTEEKAKQLIGREWTSATRLKRIIHIFAEKREKIIIGNWLKASKIFKNKFDIIIGDLVTNNLTYPELKIFFREMKKILKPKGSLILTNAGIYTKQKMTTEKMIDRVKKNPGYYQDKRNLKYDTYLAWAGNPRFYNPKTRSLYFDIQDIIFKKKFKAGELTKKELKLITTGLGHVRISVLGKEIETLMRKHFKIVSKLKERAKRGFENHKVFDLYYIYELKIK